MSQDTGAPMTPICPVCGGVMSEAPISEFRVTGGTPNIWGLTQSQTERIRSFQCFDSRGRVHATTMAREDA
jgi:hypothetical protein